MAGKGRPNSAWWFLDLYVTAKDYSKYSYKGQLSYEEVITPSATFDEGPQGSPNMDQSIQDSLFLWVSVHRHYETQH
ncbi:hypothetical protein Trydic_g9631 [Trypoxylus dichotomus]